MSRVRRSRRRLAPVPHVVNVQTKAEDVGGNEAELGRVPGNQADDDAVHAGQHPAVPISFPNQNSGEYSQQAGNVVKSQHGAGPSFNIILKPPPATAQITNVMESFRNDDWRLKSSQQQLSAADRADDFALSIANLQSSILNFSRPLCLCGETRVMPPRIPMAARTPGCWPRGLFPAPPPRG